MYHNSAQLCVSELAAKWQYHSRGSFTHRIDKMPEPCVVDLAWLILLGPVMHETRTFKS